MFSELKIGQQRQRLFETCTFIHNRFPLEMQQKQNNIPVFSHLKLTVW